MFHDAGVPKDAYINIYATNDQIAWVIPDPRVQGVSLTGSGRAGAAVAEIAGRHLKKVVLELGGSDPFLVLKNDDLDAVVEAAVGGRLENTGQACNAAKRFIVLDDQYDAFVEKFAAALTQVEPGDPHSEGSAIGPLSSTAAADRLEQQVKTALDNGANLVAGGGREGNFFKTAVMTDITPDNPAYTEEFFGPVAQVYKAGSEEEAVRLANDTPYGLGSYVYTNDSEQALRVADQIEAGMVFINAVGAAGGELLPPFRRPGPRVEPEVPQLPRHPDLLQGTLSGRCKRSAFPPVQRCGPGDGRRTNGRDRDQLAEWTLGGNLAVRYGDHPASSRDR
jgi:succinate-semialdehyde dehydrogenase/glutarate-semialdehyde dehydrogenase